MASNVIADVAPTPRYVTLDDNPPRFDFIVVGGGVRGLTTAVNLSSKWPQKSILLIEASREGEFFRVLPPMVALKSEQHDLVNRSLTEWTAHTLQMPIMPPIPEIISKGVSKAELSKDQYPTLLKVDSLNRPTNPTLEELNTCRTDLTFWRELAMKGTPERRRRDPIRYVSMIKTLSTRDNVVLLFGTNVTMINYKHKMINTLKMRLVYNEAIHIAAPLKCLIPDIEQCGVSQSSIRFYPALPDDILRASRLLNYVPIRRTQLSFNEPFWTAREGCDTLFYLAIPDLSNVIVGVYPMSDRRSLEVCVSPWASCSRRRVGKTVYEEMFRIVKVLSILFDVCIAIEDGKTIDVQGQPRRRTVRLVGIRHFDSKSTYQQSVMLQPDERPLRVALDDFQSSKRNIIFVEDSVVLDCVDVSPSKRHRKVELPGSISSPESNLESVTTSATITPSPPPPTEMLDTTTEAVAVSWEAEVNEGDTSFPPYPFSLRS